MWAPAQAGPIGAWEPPKGEHTCSLTSKRCEQGEHFEEQAQRDASKQLQSKRTTDSLSPRAPWMLLLWAVLAAADFQGEAQQILADLQARAAWLLCSARDEVDTDTAVLTFYNHMLKLSESRNRRRLFARPPRPFQKVRA